MSLDTTTTPSNADTLAGDEPPIAVTFPEYEARYRELFRDQNPTPGDVRNAYIKYASTRRAPRY
jgi:hypothetical protein